jgi:hypothetical protein
MTVFEKRKKINTGKTFSVNLFGIYLKLLIELSFLSLPLLPSLAKRGKKGCRKAGMKGEFRMP